MNATMQTTTETKSICEHCAACGLSESEAGEATVSLGALMERLAAGGSP